MSGSSLIFEFHPWRGIKRVGGELGAITTLGFVSVSYVPFLVTEWLTSKLKAMRMALGTGNANPRLKVKLAHKREMRK